MALMEYTGKDKFHLALDCVIFGFDSDQLKLLVYRRNFEPEIGKYSLMGGFLRRGENLNQAASRILTKITGLENIYLEQLAAFSEVNRDPVDQVISMGYYALINIQDYNPEMMQKYGAEWFPIEQIPTLIFDHNEIVEKALKRLRRKAKSQPIGFELLPGQFTLTELKSLYEAIYQRKIDSANFRRKFLSTGLLNKLPAKDKINSRKGAFLFEFNQEKYENLSSMGFVFDVSKF